jgi:hypothetical protein
MEQTLCSTRALALMLIATTLRAQALDDQKPSDGPRWGLGFTVTFLFPKPAKTP